MRDNSDPILKRLRDLDKRLMKVERHRHPTTPGPAGSIARWGIFENSSSPHLEVGVDVTEDWPMAVAEDGGISSLTVDAGVYQADFTFRINCLSTVSFAVRIKINTSSYASEWQNWSPATGGSFKQIRGSLGGLFSFPSGGSFTLPTEIVTSTAGIEVDMQVGVLFIHKVA